MDRSVRDIILYCVAGVLAVIGLILVIRWIASEVHVSNAREGQDPPFVMDLSFPEGYVTEYDKGVAAYQRGDYVDAERYFESAAASDFGEPQDCDIRVNWALSICNQINFDDLDTDAKKQKAISYLLNASGVLCENGCAVWGRQGQWHDDEAQQLEDDIEKMLSELQDSQDQDQDQNQDPNQNPDNQDQQQPPPESDEEKEQRQQKQKEIEENRSATMKKSQRERQYQENSKGFSWGGESW